MWWVVVVVVVVVVVEVENERSLLRRRLREGWQCLGFHHRGPRHKDPDHPRGKRLLTTRV